MTETDLFANLVIVKFGWEIIANIFSSLLLGVLCGTHQISTEVFIFGVLCCDPDAKTQHDRAAELPRKSEARRTWIGLRAVQKR